MAFYPRADKKSIDRRSMKSVPAPPYAPMPGDAQRIQAAFAKAVPFSSNRFLVIIANGY
jgi:hypothetical protein